MAETQALSLYLDLEEGRTADLEVVARAAIEFAAALKAIAHAIDPELHVQVALVSGSPGSLSLNTLIKAAKDTAREHPTLVAVVAAVGTYFSGHVGSHIVEHVTDKITDRVVEQVMPDTKVGEAEKKAIDEAVEKALKSHAGEGHIKALYSQLERDPAVKGVGTSVAPSTPPPVIIPRAEFRERSDYVRAAPEPETRVEPSEVRVILTQPVLDETSRRRWRFRFAEGGEFTAEMRDSAFLQKMLGGEVQVPLRTGVQMVVKMVRRQRKSGDHWEDTSIVIEQVLRVLAPAAKPHASLAETLESDPSDSA